MVDLYCPFCKHVLKPPEKETYWCQWCRRTWSIKQVEQFIAGTPVGVSLPGETIERCSKPALHNFKKITGNSRCEWCGKTVTEIMIELLREKHG